jgi:methionyl-tRNA formyltransferase
LLVLEQIASDTVKWQEQDHTRATFAPKLEREEALLCWQEPAMALARRVRAFAPSPGAYTLWRGEPLRILRARAEPGPAPEPPGRVRLGESGSLRVATGDGWLVPLTLQRPGGRPLDVAPFLRGRPIPDGARLGADSGDGP